MLQRFNKNGTYPTKNKIVGGHIKVFNFGVTGYGHYFQGSCNNCGMYLWDVLM